MVAPTPQSNDPDLNSCTESKLAAAARFSPS